MIEHNNLEEYQDPVNYDLEFGGETDKWVESTFDSRYHF